MNARITGKQRYKHLYHYTSFDSFVRIWLSGKLRFSEVNCVNDLLEVHFSVRTPNWQQIDLLDHYNTIRRSYKQISFTMDYNSHTKGCMSPMMWGIYAGKRHGVCMEFDYDKIQFPEGTLQGVIHYRRTMEQGVELDSSINSDSLSHFIIKHRKKIFFTKHISWAGENEFRVLNNQTDYLEIKNAITNIYLTLHDSQECFWVEKLVGNRIPVMYFGYKRDSATNYAIPFIQNIHEYRNDMEKSILPVIKLDDNLKSIFHLK